MRIDLGVSGHEVHFVGISTVDAAGDQDRLVEQCAFPLFQDLSRVDVQDLHDGHKDDIYIYDRDGRLAVYLPIRGEIETDLSSEEGYRNLRAAILSVE